MTDTNQKQLGNTLWKIADDLRGAMNADDFRDYMLSFLFLRYLSDNYETAAKKELGRDYPEVSEDARQVPLALWYANNPNDVSEFEKQMRRKVHYVIKPEHLWSSIANMARTQSSDLLSTLQEGFKYIENESFESTFQGLFSEINLGSDKLGKTYSDRNAKLCTILQKIAEGLSEFSTDVDALGDAYEYLIGQFAAGSGKKAGEFYTPQQMSDILSAIVTLDSQEPNTGPKKRLESVMDFACGSGSLLLNVRKRMKENGGTIGKIFGQEKNITTYNLSRMNMLLHGVKDSEFEIFHGEIKTVVVYKLDRLSRSLQDGINILARWCDKGLRVVSVTQQIDFNGAIGKMLAAVLLGIAEMEQEMRRERQAAGIQAAKKAGVYLGRKPGTVKSSPRRAIELRDKGNTIDEIAAALQVSRRTVHRYLNSEG